MDLITIIVMLVVATQLVNAITEFLKTVNNILENLKQLTAHKKRKPLKFPKARSKR